MWIKYSASVPESADSTSDYKPDFDRWADHLALSAWWRGKPSASASWAKRLKKGGWMNALSGAVICETYPSANFRPSTGLQADTPASPSVQQGINWGKRTLVICGPTSSTSSELFDLEGFSLRTSQDISRSALIASFRTWKDAVSAARSDCLRRRKLARRIGESESSYSAWPTPTATANQTAPSMRKHPGCAAFWPTPTANEDACGTPNGKMQKMLGNHPLVRGLPDQENPANCGSLLGPLNPDWVEELMGFPTGWTDCER